MFNSRASSQLDDENVARTCSAGRPLRAISLHARPTKTPGVQHSRAPRTNLDSSDRSASAAPCMSEQHPVLVPDAAVFCRRRTSRALLTVHVAFVKASPAALSTVGYAMRFLDMKQNVLILCTGNSCRSQMAEGFLRSLAGDRFDVYSAGTEPKGEVHPLAVQVMAEIGVDISEQRPKGLHVYLGRLPVRYLIVVCSSANESCPRFFPGLSERLHWPFDDPAEFKGTPEDRLAEFRHVRDEIRARLTEWACGLPVPAA